MARELSKRLLAAGVGLLLAGCGSEPRALDLLRAGETLLEAQVAGKPWHPPAATPGELGLNDEVHRALPAGPPSRFRFKVTLPPEARLHFACGIDPKHQARPGVEFVVKIGRGRGGDEDTIWTRLVDPLSRREDSRWVRGEVDLARWAGKAVELALETRGYEETGDPAQAVWGTPTITGAGGRAPLIVLYLVDALRADHTGPYGYPRDTTPSLDEFARDAVAFEQAVAHSSWTKPSVASMMTSLLPARHGAMRRIDPLPARHSTLAERLQERGWGAGAAVANVVLYAARSGFDQGFDYFAGLHGPRGLPSRRVRAPAVVDTALSWLDTRRGLPTFLYVHTMDPHFPYDPPPPFDRMFAPESTPGPPAGTVPPGLGEADGQERRRTIAQYDGEVAFGDREFGRFLRELKTRGLYDRALILFLSDHGEEFLDHGGRGHGSSLFEELVHIPLVVKFPQGRHAGKRVARLVQGIDVMPTVLEAAGGPPPDGLTGRPLQRVLVDDARAIPAFVELAHWNATCLGVRTETEKYIRRFSPQDDELYFDLVRDPGERVNRIGANAERGRFLRAQVEGIMQPAPFRYVLRATGSGRFSLALDTSGRLERLEAAGLGADETPALGASGRRLVLELRPRPGSPREVSFAVRPMGAPVSLQGTRDGRPLRPRDLAWAGNRHPQAFPARLPDPEIENPPGRAHELFSPPEAESAGLQVWLVASSPQKALEFDEETLEALKALGYAGP